MMTVNHLYQSLSAFIKAVLCAFLLFFSLSSLASPENVKDAKFSHQTVLDLAKKLAKEPYKLPKQAPISLTRLDAETYQKIRFQQHAAIWGNSPSPFSIQLFAPGFLYKNLVNIDIVESGKSVPINVTESSFKVPNPVIAKALAQVGKYAGFRLHYPLNNSQDKNEFIIFQGASYFRAVSKGQLYGISARGLAIDVAEPKGEEHPTFTHFWIERPGREQKAIVVHALLNSKSVTGAYRFGIYPDDPTHMDVKVTLFPRADIPHIGLAPLTSMFLHGGMVPAKSTDYRPEVHNSQALAITTGNNEHLWRPLNNPSSLQISGFMDEHTKGFGLIQRDRQFVNYQDLEAHYELRPSLWVEPIEDWGKGQVQLFEIPSNADSNDNIVAYWRPEGGLKKGQTFSYNYRLIWLNDINPMPGKTKIVRSAKGQPSEDGNRVMIIDFSQISTEQLKTLSINASSNHGKIVKTKLIANPNIDGARVFLTFNPENADVAELRLQLMNKNIPISETWLYRWIKPGLFTGE